jgi:hypothetical protein
MATFLKTDLKYDYNWNQADNAGSNYRDFYDQIKINKTEGNEVLYFCEKFLEVHSLPPTLENFLRVETLLQSNTSAPLETRLELYNFIALHWTNNEINPIYHNTSIENNQSDYNNDALIN